MAIVSVGMLRGNKDALCWQDEDGDVHIGAVLSGRISHCLSSLFSDIQQIKMCYTLEPKWYILDLIDKSKTVKFVLIEFENWYKTNTENHLNAPLMPPLDITKLMVCSKQYNPVPIWHDEPLPGTKYENLQDIKLNKEKRMLWKNKSDYAKENLQLKKELEVYDCELKIAKADLEQSNAIKTKLQNELEIAKVQYEHQIRKLRLELDRVLDGTAMQDLKDKHSTVVRDLKGAKEYITKLESQTIYHDLDVNARDRQIENFKDEVISLKEKIATLTDELNAVDGLSMTKELVDIVKSLKDDETGMFDKLLKTITETAKAK